MLNQPRLQFYLCFLHSWSDSTHHYAQLSLVKLGSLELFTLVGLEQGSSLSLPPE
jgi:hypothetical protein